MISILLSFIFSQNWSIHDFISSIEDSTTAVVSSWSFIEKTTVKHYLSRLTPIIEASARVDIFVRSSGQADLWSDVPPGAGYRSGWHLVRFWVRLTFGQVYPLGEAFGQVDIFVRSSGQADLWSDVPPWAGYRSGWHLVRFWVRLTFGQV